MKIRFRNGEWVSYKLGKIDTVVGRADGALTFDRFKIQYLSLLKIGCILLMQTKILNGTM